MKYHVNTVGTCNLQNRPEMDSSFHPYVDPPLGLQPCFLPAVDPMMNQLWGTGFCKWLGGVGDGVPISVATNTRMRFYCPCAGTGVVYGGTVLCLCPCCLMIRGSSWLFSLTTEYCTYFVASGLINQSAPGSPDHQGQPARVVHTVFKQSNPKCPRRGSIFRVHWAIAVVIVIWPGPRSSGQCLSPSADAQSTLNRHNGREMIRLSFQKKNLLCKYLLMYPGSSSVPTSVTSPSGPGYKMLQVI